jgi:hypothetical protein
MDGRRGTLDDGGALAGQASPESNYFQPVSSRLYIEVVASAVLYSLRVHPCNASCWPTHLCCSYLVVLAIFGPLLFNV